jgi:hypothetical protein
MTVIRQMQVSLYAEIDVGAGLIVPHSRIKQGGIMKTGLCAAATLFLLLVAPHTQLCHSATQYTIRDLGQGVLPAAINNSGDVAGAIVSSGTGPEAFLYKGGTLTRLGKFGGTGSWAFAINDHGDALVTVCMDTDCNLYRAIGAGYEVLIKDGQVRDLRTTAAHLASAERINNSGQILGFESLSAGTARVVLYDYVNDAAKVIAQLPPGDPGFYGFPTALNDLGDAVYTYSLCGEVGCQYPQLYRGGSSQPLEWNWSVTDINDRGQITGADGCGVLYESGATLLQDGDVCFVPNALNNETLMVGRANIAMQLAGPATYSNGQTTLFSSTQLNTEDSWQIGELIDINDQGQIIGKGTKNGELDHGFIMTPVTATRHPVTLTIEGSGHGSVNGSMSCVSGSPCPPVTFGENSQVYLVPSPDAYSLFGGWRGDCTLSGNTCVLTINAPKTVTATFDAAPRVMVGAAVYNTISAALAAAPDNSVIQALSAVFDEPLITFQRPVRLILKGGYDAGYTQQSGLTTVNGRLQIRNGTLRVSRVALR